MSIKKKVKALFFDPNGRLVRVDGKVMSYHDSCHLQVSKLPRIKMLGFWVSGTHGITVAVFGRQNDVAEYSGYLDEIRVAIHQLIIRPSAIAFVRYCYWAVVLAFWGDNMIRVTLDHIASMKEDRS